mgnify:CR=1 FL=1
MSLGNGSNYTGTANQWNASEDMAPTSHVNWMDSTSNNYFITGVQFEEGDEVTPFEHRPFTEELLLCQRYFQRLGYGRSSTYVAIGILVNSTQARCTVNLGVSMRDQPTASEVGTLKADTEMSSSTNVTSVVSDYTTVNGGRVNFNIDSHSQGQGQVIQILTDTTTSGLDFDAEL